MTDRPPWRSRAPLNCIFALVLSVGFTVGATSDAAAQSFFATLIVDPTVGVDKGSASRVQQVDKTTRYLTFDSYGSDDVGPYNLGFGVSLPNLAASGDQLDVAAVVSGPSETGAQELKAGGVAYRFPLGTGGAKLTASLDHGDVKLGTETSLAFGITGHRTLFSVGATKSWDLPQVAKLTVSGELSARDISGFGFGTKTVDESLRYVRASLLYEQGIPLVFQRRFAASVTQGLSGLGASPAKNPLSSRPGAASDFLRVALSAETSIPLSREFVANIGLIGQWTSDVMPSSQQCGFASNGYARGFDLGYVSGDRCLGTRSEIAYNIELPNQKAMRSDAPLRFSQAYFGVDYGVIDNVGSSLSPEQSDEWSSLSLGVRALRGNIIGEISISHILTAPPGITEQDDTRLWLRAAIAF